MPRLPQFPQIIRIQNCDSTLTIRRYQYWKKKRYLQFRFSHHIDGQWKRETFSNYPAAKSRAEILLTRLANHQVLAAQLTDVEANSYWSASQHLQDFENPPSVDQAVHEYAQARKILGGASLIEAARFYMSHHGRLPVRSVSQVFRSRIIKCPQLSHRTDGSGR